MANIKSAKKRVLVNQKKAARNQMIKSAVKTEVKKVRAAIDKAESKGVFKKNTASRKVSRLALAVNKMA